MDEHRTTQQLHDERWSLLEQINRATDTPMIALSFVWLGLVILDFTQGLGPALQTVSNIIWGVFVLDSVLEFTIAPRKVDYLKRSWLTAISLVLPALRLVRIVRVVRLLRVARAARSLRLLRVVTSLNRGLRAVGNTFARRGIGYVVAITTLVTFGGAAGMYAFENPQALVDANYLDAAHAADGAGIASYGEAVWWTAMIMVTMGSDYWPQTVEGRILGWLLALYAFAIFGYITATIASYFVGRDTAVAQGDDGTARNETSVAEAARKHGLTVAEVEDWRERFLAGAENALRSRPAYEDGQKDREIKRLKQKVGELVMDVNILKEAVKGHPSLRQMHNE